MLNYNMDSKDLLFLASLISYVLTNYYLYRNNQPIMTDRIKQLEFMNNMAFVGISLSKLYSLK